MKGIILIALLVSSVFVSAQVKHVVQPKETLYGLSKEYGVTQQQILDANPSIQEKGLQIGDEIIIPTSNGNDGTLTPKPDTQSNFTDDNYLYITVQPQETLYNLSKTYNISIEALESLNPNLSSGLKEGDVIRVPKWENQAPTGYHKMEAGETLYTLSRMYDVPIADILLVNPDLQVDNIQIGQYVKIPNENMASTAPPKPVKPNQTKPNQPVTQPTPNDEEAAVKNGYYEYTVKKGESLFGILTNFDITLEEFVNANPNVQSKVEAGDVVNIPIKSDTKFVKAETYKEKDDTVRVALFLPFFLDDDSKKGQKEISTLFLSGAKLALDSLSSGGKKIKVEVVDSGNENLFQSTLDSGKIYNADLYIGPFYKSSIMALREKTNLSSIPIVSPLVKDQSMEQASNIIFANVDDYTLADKIIEEVNAVYKGQKIIFVTDSDGMKVTEYMVKNFTASGKVTETVFSSESIVQNQNLVTEEYENVILVLVTEEESLGQSFIDKVDTMDNNSVLPFSVFYLNTFDKASNIAKLRKKGFVSVASRKVNTKGTNEKETLNKYQKEYCQSPPKYAVIGFDIVYDLLTRMDANKNLMDHMNTVTTQLATKFEYEKLPSNSYQNVGVRVIRYTKINEN